MDDHYNERMLALRFVAGLALVSWLGGALAIGSVVAPSAFAVLPASDAASIVGETLRRFHLVAYGAGAALVGSFILMAALGPRPRAFGVRLSIALMMLGATILSGCWVDRRIASLRRDIGVPVSSLAADDPRRTSFGRLHGLSTLLLGLTACGGLVLLYLDARDSR
jgi:hypothetical protein